MGENGCREGSHKATDSRVTRVPGVGFRRISDVVIPSTSLRLQTSIPQTSTSGRTQAESQFKSQLCPSAGGVTGASAPLPEPPIPWPSPAPGNPGVPRGSRILRHGGGRHTSRCGYYYDDQLLHCSPGVVGPGLLQLQANRAAISTLPATSLNPGVGDSLAA